MEELKKFRNAQGCTIKQFAELIGVSFSLYAKIEQGKRKPSTAFIEKFKKRFPSFDINRLY